MSQHDQSSSFAKSRRVQRARVNQTMRNASGPAVSPLSKRAKNRASWLLSVSTLHKTAARQPCFVFRPRAAERAPHNRPNPSALPTASARAPERLSATGIGANCCVRAPCRRGREVLSSSPSAGPLSLGLAGALLALRLESSGKTFSRHQRDDRSASSTRRCPTKELQLLPAQISASAF